MQCESIEFLSKLYFDSLKWLSCYYVNKSYPVAWILKSFCKYNVSLKEMMKIMMIWYQTNTTMPVKAVGLLRQSDKASYSKAKYLPGHEGLRSIGTTSRLLHHWTLAKKLNLPIIPGPNWRNCADDNFKNMLLNESINIFFNQISIEFCDVILRHSFRLWLHTKVILSHFPKNMIIRLKLTKDSEVSSVLPI